MTARLYEIRRNGITIREYMTPARAAVHVIAGRHVVPIDHAGVEPEDES